MKTLFKYFIPVVTFVSTLLLADVNNFRFEVITTRNGLSDNEISAISNDGRGFIWLGTNEGLNRYDGYNVTVYNSNPFDVMALSGNRIWDIYKDTSGDIWAITDKGLDRYIYGKNKFRRFRTDSRPTFVVQDREGIIWVATENSGLYSINKETGENKNYIFDPSDPYSISSNQFDQEQFNPIVVDTSGNLWVGTLNGLNYYHKEKDFFQRFKSAGNPNEPNYISDNHINTLMVRDNDVYIGTPRGLDKLHIGDFSITHYAGTQWFSALNSYSVNQILDFGSQASMVGFWVSTTTGMVFYNAAFDMFEDLAWDYLFGQYIKKAFVDPSGNLWIDVLAFPGLVHFNTSSFFTNSGLFNETDFQLLQPNSEGVLIKVIEPESISNADVNDLFIDDFNNIWVGTQMGLNHLIKSTKSFVSFTAEFSQIKGSNIRSIKIAKDNSLWISHEKGLDHLSDNQKLIKHYTSDPTNINSLLTEETNTLEITADGRIWAASQFQGMTLIDPSKNKFKRFNKIIDHQSAVELGGKINVIYEDRSVIWFATHEGLAKLSVRKSKEQFSVYKFDLAPEKEFLSNPTALLRDNKNNELWVGTESNGLFRINDDKMETTIHYVLDENDERSFSSNAVKTIYEDKKGNIWIGSAGEGLYRYNRDSDDFDRWSTQEGLPSNTVLSIVDDKEGSVWLGTRRGISRLLDNNRFQSFEISDGLPANIFNDRSIAMNSKGEVYFGSVSGLTVVDPKLIVTNNETPKLAISNIEAIDYEGNKYPVDFSDNQFSIDHTIQTINIDFVGLTFNKATKNQYQYTLDNYLSNWVNNNNNRSAAFQGLDAGKYVFQFKASNNDGVWNEEPYSINMRVKPPIWETWYAYTFYFFGLIGLGASGFVGADRYRRKAQESNRKDKELADAREFQLRMVAQEIPDFAGIDIKAFMQTSTEVGGDYYDFFEMEDGSFYAVCGDATGHGSQSGMMVSITKAGLAGMELNSPDQILNKLNKVVRRVDTGRLRMSLTVCIFRGNYVHISAAAMPPAYLYSSRKNMVEEIEICNLPLGGLSNETFDEVVRSFDEGDVLVLLSDGLPEAPNSDGHLLDYPAVKECIEETAYKGAALVKKSLVELANGWLEGDQPPDDITFVVFEKNRQKQSKKKEIPLSSPPPPATA